MSAGLETQEQSLDRVVTGLVATTARRGDGMGKAHCVRLNDVVLPLLEAAKPEGQSMVSFLKECAITVSLQRLEASQN